MTEQEQKKIEAIRILRKDFELFAKRCLKIKTKAAKIVPFVFNRAQRRVTEYLFKCLIEGNPIRAIILKARQLGLSTLISGFFYWIESMNPNRGALVVCHDLDSAQGLFDKYKLYYKCSPVELRPMRKISNRRELYFANRDETGPIGLESRIMVDTADNPDLGASFTIQLVHLSEFARYERVTDVKTMMTSLNQAIPDLPGTAKIIETTAQGSGYFKDMWDDEESIYEKIFISWVADDTYRRDDVPVDFMLADHEDNRYGDELRESDLVRSQIRYWYPEKSERTPENMKWLEQETVCRLWWRRWTIDNKCEKDKIKFRQEYPTTPEDSFAVSGTGIFDQKKLASIRKEVKDAIMVGQVKPLNYSYSSKASIDKTRDWWSRAFYSSHYGPLVVYESPRPGLQYVIGADPSEGLISGGDDAAACVLRCPDLKQVAVWCKPIEPDEYADLLFALGMLYNKALIGVEVEGPGRATILRLSKELFYPNLYYREIHDDIRNKRQMKHGWYTTQITKPIMVSGGQAAIRDDDIQLLDLPTIEQLIQFEKKPDGSYGAPQGKHDDLVSATLIAIQMAKQVHIPLSRQSRTPPRFSCEGLIRQLEKEQRLPRSHFGEDSNFTRRISSLSEDS